MKVDSAEAPNRWYRNGRDPQGNRPNPGRIVPPFARVRSDASMDDRIKGILGFFEPEVLAAYREQPDKFELTTDHFEGHLTISSAYYARLDEKSQDKEYIEIRFGYRTLRNGDLKLAVFLPDLIEKSRGHLERWKAFVVNTDQWLE